ncbi:MAG TPA: hypothetical protein V6D12_06105 [Candidatus Obscuribacterales bacterium]
MRSVSQLSHFGKPRGLRENNFSLPDIGIQVRAIACFGEKAQIFAIA